MKNGLRKSKKQKDVYTAQIRAVIGRRHPEYARLLPHWEFLDATYRGGREWFTPDNIFRYYKEGDTEYKDRLKRAYRFNHTREVVDLVDKYLFKMPIERKEDAPEQIKRFWKRATLNGQNIRDFMKQVSNLTSRQGRIWVVVDTNKSEEVQSIADEKRADVRVYAYTVSPINVCDMSYDDNRQLNWILIHEQVRDDTDPMTSGGLLIDRYRLWERHQSTTFTVDSGQSSDAGTAAAVFAINSGRTGHVATIDAGAAGGGSFRIHVGEPQPHGFGGVPVFPVDHVISDELYWSPSMIDDVAYLDRAVANYLSNLDAIIQDQTFSQLVIPSGGIPESTTLEDESTIEERMVKLGTSRIFTYNHEAGAPPTFISPDVKQAELILSAIEKIVAEIYHTTGLSGERTKDDNGAGIDNSSGVAKAYDFERVNSMLAAKADSLELAEHKLAQFVGRWHGIHIDDDERMVSYPDNFDVRGLRDEFSIAGNLSLISAPDTVRREQMRTLINKLFPQIKESLLEEMKKELQSWPPKLEVEPGQSAQGGQQKEFKKAATNSLANKTVKQAA